MPINYNEIPSELLTRSDAEIAFVMSAMTKGPINVGVLRPWLSQQGLAKKSQRTQVLTGSLVSFCDAPGVPVELIAGLDEFFDHVFDDKMEAIATHQPAWAEKAESLLLGLEAAGAITHDQHIAFHEKDGGFRWPAGVTEADVVAAKAAKVAQDAADANKETINTAWTAHASGVMGHLSPNAIPDMQDARDAIQAFLTAIGG